MVEVCWRKCEARDKAWESNRSLPRPPQTDQMILQYHCGRVFKRIFCADRAGVVVHTLAKQKSQLWWWLLISKVKWIFVVLHASCWQGHLLHTTSNTSWFSDPYVDQWTLLLEQKMIPWRVPTRYFVCLQNRRLCISEFRMMYSRVQRGHFKVWFYAHPHVQIFCSVLNDNFNMQCNNF